MTHNNLRKNLPDQPEDGEPDDRVIGQAFRWSLVALVLIGGGITGTVLYLNRPKPQEAEVKINAPPPKQREAAKVRPPKVIFKDITDESGVTFVQENGAYGDKLLPETIGSGCGLFDYDNDGDLDLLLVNSCAWDWHPKEGPPAVQALYQNDGTGKFLDVTADVGLNLTFYGMGCAVADYDGDGWTDLYITAVGKNRLFKNEQGKFRDVTEEAGVAGTDDAWSSCATFFDCDQDGDLDLFVGNYVKWSKDIDLSQNFQLTGIGRAYGPPTAFEGTFPFLFRNDGNGKFTEIVEAAGLHVRNAATGVPLAKSLGVVPIDLDHDRRVDLIVANDTVQNLVFHNLGDGRFEEIGTESGMAFDAAGSARGAMGTDAAYFRNDKSLAVAIGNFAMEMTALYVSQDDPLAFTDDSVSTGLGPITRTSLTFGLFFFDYDLDGRRDLLTVNGHLESDINRVQSSQFYEQPPHLFWNAGDAGTTEFLPVNQELCGEDLLKPQVGRGSAYGDLDGDGDLDCVLTATASRPRILRNDLDNQAHWLRVKLVGDGANRDAIGARISLQAGGGEQTWIVSPTRSYLSQSECVATFGLGKSETIKQLTVTWPDGEKQTIPVDAIDSQLTIRRADSPSAKTANTTSAAR